LAADPIVSRSVVEGLPTLLEYYESGDIDSLIKATELVVKQLVAEGHVTDEIAVLTVKGAESSELLKQASLGQYSFNKIIGRTTAGDFEYSGGEILADTVFRFKGRSANCVVLTELDFEDLDENRKRRLFVGLTRARLRLALVMSKSAAKLLIGEVEN
jgi:hypothetical protein